MSSAGTLLSLHGAILCVVLKLCSSHCVGPSTLDPNDTRYGVAGFDCASGQPSPSVPSSVHRLRPGDIRVVAALGDSLTAGNGAGAHNPLEVICQYRGLSFSIGGDARLENTVTLPNILRKFNANLFGQAHGSGGVDKLSVSQLNVAIPGSVSESLLGQAREVVRRMQTEFSQQIDFQNDWKLITIFSGGNDLCRYCHDRSRFSAQNFTQNIRRAVVYLKNHVPRALVQVVTILHVELLRKTHEKILCRIAHSRECPCSTNKHFTDADFNAIVRAYQAAEGQLESSGDFDTTDDFTVVMQPFMADTSDLARHADGNLDYDWLAQDCFHFHRKGHSTIARGLWNDMLQPVGGKARNFNFTDIHAPINCPPADCPYIRTTKNSQHC